MANLVKLGFSKNIIVETIVSTYNADGLPNAAPMGVTMQNTRHIAIRPYTSTLTFKNLESKRCAVINVTSDPELYYRTAFKEVNQKGNIPQEWFEKAGTIDAPKLKMAEACIEVSVVNISRFQPERANVLCQVKSIKASRNFPKVYCRGLFATIEAITHATRVKVLINDPHEQEHVGRLLKTIDDCIDVVNRVAPNSLFYEIMEDLNKRIVSWKRQT